MYKGLNCDCKVCQNLTPEERAAKYARVQAARRQGGKTRAAQPSMEEARRKGFYTTCFERGYGLWLKKRIRRQRELRTRQAATKSLIPERKPGRRRPMK